MVNPLFLGHAHHSLCFFFLFFFFLLLLLLLHHITPLAGRLLFLMRQPWHACPLLHARLEVCFPCAVSQRGRHWLCLLCQPSVPPLLASGQLGEGYSFASLSRLSSCHSSFLNLTSSPCLERFCFHSGCGGRSIYQGISLPSHSAFAHGPKHDNLSQMLKASPEFYTNLCRHSYLTEASHSTLH